MTSPVIRTPSFQNPPATYQAGFFSVFFRDLRLYLELLRTPGWLVEGQISLIDCPSSGVGLKVGDVYEDGSYLRVVKTGDAFVTGTSVITGLGTVTVVVT